MDNPINPTEDFTTPQTIAAALEAVAQRLRALPDIDIPATRVHVDLWVYDGGDQVEARKTVDVLGQTVCGETGSQIFTTPESGTFYKTHHVDYMKGLVAEVVTVDPSTATKRPY